MPSNLHTWLLYECTGRFQPYLLTTHLQYIVLIFSIQRCTKQNIIKRFKLYTYYYISEYLFIFVLHEMYRAYGSKYMNT